MRQAPPLVMKELETRVQSSKVSYNEGTATGHEGVGEVQEFSHQRFHIMKELEG